MDKIVHSLFSHIYPHLYETETWYIYLKKKKKSSWKQSDSLLCKCVHHQRLFSILSHHARKDGCCRVVWVGKVRWGVEGSRRACSVDAVAVGSQWKGVDGLLRPGGLQGFCEGIKLQSGVPPPLPALTRHLPVACLNSVLLHSEWSVHLRRLKVRNV